MRGIIVLAVCLFAGSSVAQVSKYLDGGTVCPEVLVIRPSMDTTMFQDLDEAERSSTSAAIGSAVSGSNVGATTIGSEALSQYDSCRCKIILVRIDGYHKKSASMGQSHGVLIVSIMSFADARAEKPLSVVQYTAKGEAEWGDTAPINAAISELSRQLAGKRPRYRS